MEPLSLAPPTTRSSPKQDGDRLAPWRSVRWRSARKACACCGKEFRPWVKIRPDGTVAVQKEKLWIKQRFCSRSCSKIQDNCMRSPTVRRKVSDALKAAGHAPPMRGGNGQLTLPQKMLLRCLGKEWVAEFTVPVPDHKAHALPKSLSIDIAHPQMMIAIELDGSSHRSPVRRLQDSRKTTYLAQKGWFVYRVTNQRAAELCSTCKSPATLLSTLTAFSPTTAT